MPTNEDKREVARRIRMGSPDWVGDHYEKWLGPTFGTIVLSGGGKDEIESAARHLADLIDPEPERTCKRVKVYSFRFPRSAWYMGCSICKNPLDVLDLHCKNCGARVVYE